jgi:hypothetical protein
MAKPVKTDSHSLTAAGPSRNCTEFPVRGGLKISQHRHLTPAPRYIRRKELQPVGREFPTQPEMVHSPPSIQWLSKLASA